VKKATISRTPTGKYFVSILTEKEYTPVPTAGKKAGIDLGLKDFLVLSTGSKIKNGRFLKHYEKNLKLNQKHLFRKTKGSNRYERQRLKVSRIHEKISNSRMDLIRKTSLDLIKNFDVIYLEDLNIKGMVKNHKLAKSISDVSWGKFIEALTYKANWNNKDAAKILDEGLRYNISVGTTDHGRGAQIRPEKSGKSVEASKKRNLNKVMKHNDL